MKFEEIFNQAGMYVADGFAEGFCFEVDGHGFLWGKTYEDKDQVMPGIEPASIYKGLFSKTYKRVYTRQALFK